jgi:hypothetical protein
MTRKKNLYLAVLRLVARTFEDRFPDGPITINQVISDYELALMESVPEVFDGVEARGCWFHYAQAIIRKAAQLGLSKFYSVGGVAAHIIQEIIGLALLPEYRVYEGFEVI